MYAFLLSLESDFSTWNTIITNEKEKIYHSFMNILIFFQNFLSEYESCKQKSRLWMPKWHGKSIKILAKWKNNIMTNSWNRTFQCCLPKRLVIHNFIVAEWFHNHTIFSNNINSREDVVLIWNEFTNCKIIMTQKQFFHVAFLKKSCETIEIK